MWIMQADNRPTACKRQTVCQRVKCVRVLCQGLAFFNAAPPCLLTGPWRARAPAHKPVYSGVARGERWNIIKGDYLRINTWTGLAPRAWGPADKRLYLLHQMIHAQTARLAGELVLWGVGGWVRVPEGREGPCIHPTCPHCRGRPLVAASRQDEVRSGGLWILSVSTQAWTCVWKKKKKEEAPARCSGCCSCWSARPVSFS